MIDDKHGSWPHPDNYTIAALDELNFDNDSAKDGYIFREAPKTETKTYTRLIRSCINYTMK